MIKPQKLWFTNTLKQTSTRRIYMNEQKTLFLISDITKTDNHEKKHKGKPRTIKPQRNQVEMMMFSIDQLIHQVAQYRKTFCISVHCRT